MMSSSLFSLECKASGSMACRKENAGICAGGVKTLALGRVRGALRPLFQQVVAVPVRAVLQGSLLRRIVDVDDAEALGVAGVPLEVIEQTPKEVALDVHALQARVVQGLQVAQHEIDARLVRDLAVDDH